MTYAASSNRRFQESPGARCAVEMAILDLIGRRTRTPLYEILGGRVRDSVEVLALVSSEQHETEVERLLQRGVRAFKVKVGIAGVRPTWQTCHAVRTAVGREARVSADANGGFNLADAVAFAAGARDAGLDFIEQPLPASDLSGMAACASSASIPIGADEGFRSVEDIRLHNEARAASGGSLKPLKMGVGGVLAAGKLMNSLKMKVNLAGKVAESSIGSAAISHLAVTPAPVGLGCQRNVSVSFDRPCRSTCGDCWRHARTVRCSRARHRGRSGQGARSSRSVGTVPDERQPLNPAIPECQQIPERRCESVLASRCRDAERSGTGWPVRYGFHRRLNV